MKGNDSLKTLGSYIAAAASVSTPVSWQTKREENQRKRKKKSDSASIDELRHECLAQELDREEDGHIDYMA